MVGILSCNYNHMKGNLENTNSGGLTSDQFSMQLNLDYDSVHKRIIQPYCLSCHSNASGNKGNLNLETFAAVKINAEKIYYRSIEIKNMPSVYNLTIRDVQFFKDWLELGAPEKSNGERPLNLSGKNINWEFIQKEIFYSKCLNCHSQPNPIHNFDLEDYEIVKNKIIKIFEKSILVEAASITEEGKDIGNVHQQFSPNEKLGLMKWISLGLPK
jgi:uncharacterized membrane protein